MEFWLFIGGGLIFYFFFKSSISSSGQKNQRSSGTSAKNKIRVTTTTTNRALTSHTENDDDGLATFSISYGYEEEKSKNKTPGRWIKAGEAISIKGHEITRGCFYFGGRLLSLDGYGTEASLVDDSLKTVNQSIAYEDESLGYWPKYTSISEKCRGAYLKWLASSRYDPNTPLGYVFIYFYGLERRIAVDSLKGVVDDSEFKAIFREVLRLKKIYGESRSFLNYSTRLLEIMCLLRPTVVSHPELEKNPKGDSILLKHRLAKTVNEGKPIPSELALAWLKFYPDYNFRQPARRCSYEFSQMFSRLYTRKYKDGIIVKPNKTRLKIEYRPASSSLRGLEIPQEDLPDPSNLKGPTKKLIAIAEECTNAIDAYSRYLGKKDTSRTDISAVLLLPEELSDIGAALGLNKLKKWAEENVTRNDGLVDVEEFWQFTKTPLPAKINKKESELIQMFAEKAGFGVAPDTRYHHAKPSVDGKLVLFRQGHGKHFKPSKAFNEMGMTLRLGAMVATIDSHVDQSEVALLKQLINHDTNLSPVERSSLSSYLSWRLNTPSNITGLKARLEKLGVKEKSAVSRILVGVALADGKVDPGEVKQLEKLYTLLGLDKSLVTGDIHSLTAGKTGVQKTAQSSVTPEPSKEASRDFLLDESVLAIHESQTKDVQSMLGTIFADEESVEDIATAEEDQAYQEDMGIDIQHYSLYENLINKDRWPRKEMDELCKKLGLMTGGAIEIINDWSFERVDAPVLEEEADAVYVDQDIVEELEG